MLAARPLILPPRHFVYPRDAEEVERGALEVSGALLRAAFAGRAVLALRAAVGGAEPFLATCALGISRSGGSHWPLVLLQRPEEICAVAGGYAYLIDTTAPERFTMIPYRPVLAVRALPAQGLLLFVGHHSAFWRGARRAGVGVGEALG